MNQSSLILNNAIEAFLTERGFYTKPLEEMEQLMGPITFRSYMALEKARLKAELIEREAGE